ncbi:MAG: OsmC family protein [Cyclobacteriaceae bacterium]|nr:OsmC family protein [Cyclobacteriaceae bacterium]
METTVQKTINGFKLEEIQETVRVLQQNPEIAQFKFRAKNKWIQGGHNRSTITGFYGGGKEDDSRTQPFVFDNGEPPILLGNNEGANPVEFILHGLAGCTTTTMALHAAARGMAIDSIESELEGDLDVMGFLGLNENVRNGYQEIRINFKIEGDLTDDQKEELISYAKNSPVYDVVSNGVPVKFSVK